MNARELLKLNSKWRVKLPGEYKLTTVTVVTIENNAIELITSRMLVFGVLGNSFIEHKEWYKISDIDFVQEVEDDKQN